MPVKLMVTSVFNGELFWLRSTIWTRFIERAETFDSIDIAKAAFATSQKFMAPAARKQLVKNVEYTPC